MLKVMHNFPHFISRTLEEEGPDEEVEVSTRTRNKGGEKEEDSNESIRILQRENQRLQHELNKTQEEVLKLQKNENTSQPNSQIVRDIILIIDNCQIALSQTKKEDPLAAGFIMLTESLINILNHYQIEYFDPSSQKFDPKLHEAVSIIQDISLEENTIHEVISYGYKNSRNLIRPAKVIVVKN